jgi:phosphate starvation-inducible PhoH-like protein
LRRLEDAFVGTDVRVRGNEITVGGAEADRVAELFRSLIGLVSSGHHLDDATVARSIEMVRADVVPLEVFTTDVLRAPGGRIVRPKSAGQKRYVDAIADNVVTFGLGPAGTGKSWLAVATAVQALNEKVVDRIILTRPAVEAGERLGFLPGDLMAKVDPYLRPLYDALADFCEPEGLARLVERDAVEVAPLAFMRGRTLSDAFVIVDEAQNASTMQMKMFLTRIGFGSRAVITGDTTQVDVAGGRSGLAGLERVLGHIEGLAFVHLTSRDVVRHRIVQEIVDAYARADAGDPPGGA